MLTFETNCSNFYNELWLETVPFERYFSTESNIKHEMTITADEYINRVVIKDKVYTYTEAKYSEDNILLSERYKKRAAKRAVYRALSSYTDKALPWGSLTGIRPTHLAYEYLDNGGEREKISEYLIKNFDVSPLRAGLIGDIIKAQSKYYCRKADRVNLYIHIPFCPSRCSYCSFTSLVYEKALKYISSYLNVLTEEIQDTLKIVEDNGLTVDSIYIGGGTPTSLTPSELKRVLQSVPYRNVEYTLEAGRPDTITEEKLEICRAYGITRLSVNPQTLDDDVLKRIGRSHTAEQFIQSFKMAKRYGFIINTDLIAGLPEQSLRSFQNDITEMIELGPHNITVHTLSVKNGSEMKSMGRITDNTETEKMMDFAIDTLKKNNYLAYYLYRQKNMMGNLENIGFTLDGYQCRNNITTMEEGLSVLACGAGAISKRVFAEGRIERQANLRDVKLYIEQGRERFGKKRILYSK